MEKEGFLKPIRIEDLPELDDDEFCVSITKAAELSGLSESQIRYFESLQGINIGKRGPKERNRVYTKQDVKLLCWIAKQEAQPSKIANYLSQHQEEILRTLGLITLQRIVQHEESSSAYDVLVSRLVALILSIWQEAALGGGKKADAAIMGVVFGPQDETWKATFLQNCVEGRAIDLKGSLVVWSTILQEELKDIIVDPDIIFGNLNVIFSHQTWYLPSAKKLVFDTSHFSELTEPFAVAILWQPLSKNTATQQLQRSAQNVSVLQKKLASVLMASLSYTLKRSPHSTSLSASVFSRGILGRHSVLRGLRLLLETCIEPYFSDCYLYIAKFGPMGQLEILEHRGDEDVGYHPKSLATQDLPWWIRYVRKNASLALAQDAAATHLLHKGEHGSVICFPLIVIDKVVGALSIENTRADQKTHCLTERKGLADADLLRYLICIAEIAAEYLNLTESSAQKAERSKVAYASEETVAWWLDIYRFGGLNYTKFVEEVCCWMEKVPVNADDVVNLIVIDIFRESDLAAKFQGFEVIIDIVHKTRERISALIQSDSIAKDLVTQKKLMFFDTSVGEHLLFATVSNRNEPRDYLLIFLEKIRRLWNRESGDIFNWKGVDIDVALQIGICRFEDLAGYESKIASQILNYHLQELVNQIYERDRDCEQPLEHVIESSTIIRTEKVHE
ncbi:MAG: MerR family transcriptional regulator [Ktedonobacteraceae bacterium]